MVPEGIKDRLALTEDQVLNSWDLGSGEIYGSLPARYVLKAFYSRIAVDLNRSPRAEGPRGVVPLVDYAGRHIYKKGFVLTKEEVNERLQRYYFPFHDEIERLIVQGEITGLIDCHTLNGVGPRKAPDYGKRRPDVVLGNCGGPNGEPIPQLGDVTCDPILLREMASILKELGLTVKLNDPYSGGYITVHYGRILRRSGGFGVQIELNQDLLTNGTTGDLDLVAAHQIKEILEEFLARLFCILGGSV